MSRVYSTEPTPSASVTLATSHGPIEIDLWRRECPNACDTFLRLAADGYYDGLVFHRVVANQLVQTGRRRPDNNNNDDDDDDDEFSRYFSERLPENRDHLETPSRIKFDRRGRVAWARTVGGANDDVDALRGQFFVTLADAPWLDGRHCAFGTVRGATIFNALRVGRTTEGHDDGNDEDHADDAAKLRRVVLGEGTTDVEKSDPAAVPWSREKEAPKKKRRRKGTKNLNVLSFGDEELAYDRAVNVANEAGTKSRHDRPDDHHLRKETDEKVAALVDKGGDDDDDDDDVAKKPRTTNDAKSNEEAEGGVTAKNERRSTNGEDGASETMKPPSSSAESKRDRETDDRPPRSEVEARRARFLSKTKHKENPKTKGSEGNTLARLAAFRERLVRAKKGGRRAAPQDDDDENDDWMATRFECRRHPDDEVDAVDDYVVVDGRSNADGQNQRRRRRR